MASARSLVTTRCSLPCRPMRWYGPAHGFPPISRLILGVLDPLLLCWDLFGDWEIISASQLPAFTRTSLVRLPSSSAPQVDKHIRRLDTDLARFEADLKEKQIESSDYDSSSSKGKKSEEGGGAVRCGQGFRGRRKRPTSALGRSTAWNRNKRT